MSNEVVAATTTSFVFALIAVGLRLYARIALVKKLYGEDYILTTSFVVACSWWVVKVIGSVKNDDADIHLLAIISWYGTISWGLCSALTKLSIVYQYWRVFEDIRWVRQLCNYLMGFLVLYGLYSFLGAVFMCVPVSHAWAPMNSPDASCADPRIYYYLTSSVNIFADLVIFALPVRPVLQLRIPLKQRLALLCCFTFGAFVIICSIVRLYWLVEQMGLKPSRDIVERVTIWAGIEMMTSIICTCFPVLRPLITRWFPKLLSTSAGSAARSRISKHKHQIQNAIHQHKRKTSAMAQKDHAAPDGNNNEGGSSHDSQDPKRSHESESDVGERAPTFEPEAQHRAQSRATNPADLTPVAPVPMAERIKSAESRQEEGIAGVRGSVHHQLQQQQQQQQHGWNNKPYHAGSQHQQRRQSHQRDSQLLPSSRHHHHRTASASSTRDRSVVSPTPSSYTSRTTSPSPIPGDINITSIAPIHTNTDRINGSNIIRTSRSYSTIRNSRPLTSTTPTTQVPNSLRPGTTASYYHNNMPVSPQSTYQGSFRASNVSALSHYPVVGGGGPRTMRSSGSLRRSLVSSFNDGSSRESAMSCAAPRNGGPGSSASTPDLGHLYRAGSSSVTASSGGDAGDGSQRASGSSSVYSRFSSATAGLGSGWARGRGFRSFSSSGSLRSSFGTSTATSGGGGSAMNTIVDGEEEYDEGIRSVAPHAATGVEDISATLDTAIATLQERSRNRGTLIEPVPRGANGVEVYGDPGHERSYIDTDGEESGEDEDKNQGFFYQTAEPALVGPSNPWHERTPSSSKEVLAVQPPQPSSPEPMTTTTTMYQQPSTSSLRYQLHPHPQLQLQPEAAELEAQEGVSAELEAPADISPVIPMPRPVLPPLFFQPEHVEYAHYRQSVSQPHLPGFMPPTRSLPALPPPPAARSELDVTGEILEAGGEEKKRYRKNRKSAVSPLGIFEMAA